MGYTLISSRTGSQVGMPSECCQRGGGGIHDPLQKLGPPHPAGHGWQRDFPEAECVPWHTLVVDTAGTTDMQKLVIGLNSVYRHVYSPGLRGLDSIKDLSSER